MGNDRNSGTMWWVIFEECGNTFRGTQTTSRSSVNSMEGRYVALMGIRRALDMVCKMHGAYWHDKRFSFGEYKAKGLNIERLREGREARLQ